MADLVEVSEKDDPIAHKAWANWRREAFGCHFVPKAYSAPSLFPPSTQSGADAYAAFLRDIRREVKWTDKRSAVPLHPRPWNAL